MTVRFSAGCLSVGLLIATGWAAAAPPAATQADEQTRIMQQMCRQATCQHDVRVQLTRADGSRFDRTYPVMPPIVQGNGFAVLAGQTVYIQADPVGGRLTNLRAVARVSDAAKTLVASLRQTEDGGMLLEVRNPFDDVFLKFDMGIMPLDGNDLHRTSSCPVAQSSMELWPYPVFQVVMTNGRVLPKADAAALRCE